MNTVYKLHKHCNITYYAILVPAGESPLFSREVSSLLEEFSNSIKEETNGYVKFEHIGWFKSLEDQDFNGKVDETSNVDSEVLSPNDEYYDEIRPWHKYDYLNKFFRDWFSPLMKNGEEDPEYLQNIAFSYKASFESSLINSGISMGETDNVYIFGVFDCRSNCEEFEIPTDFKDKLIRLD